MISLKVMVALSSLDVTIIPRGVTVVKGYFMKRYSSGVGVTFLSHRVVCKPLKLMGEKWAKPI
jgi:hypothetical protein